MKRPLSICHKRGFTLVEVMISMVVLTIISIGLYAGSYFARAVSIQNSRRVAAVIFADGIVKQVVGLPRNTFTIVMALPASSRSVTLNLPTTDNAGSYSFAPKTITLNEWNTFVYKASTADTEKKTGNAPAFSDNTVNIRYRLNITQGQLNPLDVAAGFYYMISVDYEFESAMPAAGANGYSKTETISTAQAFGGI